MRCSEIIKHIKPSFVLAALLIGSASMAMSPPGAEANEAVQSSNWSCVSDYQINARRKGSHPDFARLTAEASIVRVIGQSEPGTGVIIGKRGNSYLVLTAGHVLKDLHGSEELIVEDYEGSTFKASNATVKNSPKYDLSLFEFTSTKRLPVQFFTRGVFPDSPQSIRYRQNAVDIFRESSPVFVAGHALLTPSSKQSFFRMTDGQIITRLSPQKADQGYDLVYSNPTVVGMSGGPIYLNQGNSNNSLMLIGIHGRGEVVDTGGGLVKTNFNYGISSDNIIEFIISVLPDFVNDYIISNVQLGEYDVYSRSNYSNYVTTDSGDFQRCILRRRSAQLRSVVINKHINHGVNVSFLDAYVDLSGSGNKWRPWKSVNCYIGGSPEAVNRYSGYTIHADPRLLFCEFTGKEPRASYGDPLDDVGTQINLEPSGNDPAPIDFSEIDFFTGNQYLGFPRGK